VRLRLQPQTGRSDKSRGQIIGWKRNAREVSAYSTV